MEHENWYVIQVQTGKEEKTADEIRRLIPGEYFSECFIPRSERLRKTEGHWIRQGDILFRGYVFLISDDIEGVSSQLSRIPDFARLLGKHVEQIYAIRRDEAIFLDTFCGRGRQVDMSYGVIEGDKIIVNSGPLMGREGIINKIDRHKRMAMIGVSMFDRMVEARVGLEIVSKS